MTYSLVCENVKCHGKFLSYLLFSFVALGLSTKVSAEDVNPEVVDLGGGTISIDTSDGFKVYNSKEIKNGTIILNNKNQSDWDEGTYIIGEGAVVNCHKELGLNVGDSKHTIIIRDGGVFNNVEATPFMFPFRKGNVQLILDGGTLTSEKKYSGNNRGSISLGYVYNNGGETKNQNISTHVVIKNDSLLNVKLGNLQIGGTRGSTSNTKAESVTTVLAVTNSSIKVDSGDIQIGANIKPEEWLNTPDNSYVKVVFGPGADLACQQIYALQSAAPSVIFDGATIHWISGGYSSFIGHKNLGDIYSIDSLGLTIDIPSGGSLTCDTNASSLKGEGGITKIGGGSITWNVVSSSGSPGMTFTGPLVVSNGTWISTLNYASSAFRVDGKSSNLTLSGTLSAENVELEATDGGTLTLSGAEFTDDKPSLTLALAGNTDYFTRDDSVKTYTLDSITLGEGAVLDLDADATGVDIISAMATNITATAANPIIINLNFSSMPKTGKEFSFIEADDIAKFNINPKFGGVTVPHELSIKNGVIVLTVTANDYTWNGTKTNWGDENAWIAGGVNATWSDGGAAIFSTANAKATIMENVSASKVVFNANATVDGGSTLTVSDVTAGNGVSAVISAPTAGALSKYGAGVLTLSQGRVDQTTLTEGTLCMAEGAALDPSKLILGTEADKPVTLDYGAQTLIANPTGYLGAGMNVTLTNGIFSCVGGVGFTDDNSPANLTIKAGARLSADNDRYTINTSGEKTINIIGGRFDASALSGNKNIWFMQNSNGRLRINAADNAEIMARGYFYVATGNDSPNLSPKVDWVMVDSRLSIEGYGLYLGNKGGQTFRNHPVQPECRFSMTNGVFNVGEGIFLGNPKTVNTSQNGGWYIAEFDNCIVTAKQCCVYGDRPASRFHFNGTTLVSKGNGDNWITAMDFENGATPVTIGEAGLVLDTNGKAMKINASLSGAGGIAVKGGGSLTFTVGNRYEGMTSVEVGTALSVMEPIAGDKLAFTIPAGLAEGLYPVVTISGKAMFASDVLTTAQLPEDNKARFILSEDRTTVYCVYGNVENSWVGGTTGIITDSSNWLFGQVPVAGETAVISSGADMTLVVPQYAKFSPSAIVFSDDCAAVTIEGAGIIEGVVAVTNLSSNVQTIACPVVFAGEYSVHCTSKSINFAGGATATYPNPDNLDNAASHTLMGEIHFTKDWTNTVALSSCYTVPKGSRLYGKHLTGNVAKTLILRVEEGGWAEFDSILTGYASGRVSVWGEMHVKNQWIATNSGTKGNCHIGDDSDATHDGAIYANGIWKDVINGNLYLKTKHFYVGSDGLGTKAQNYSLKFDVEGQVIHATDDFEIFSVEPKSDGDWGVDLYQAITLDTAGHTITWSGNIRDFKSGGAAVTKDGEGTLVMNPYYTTMKGTFTVKGGTLQVAKDAATGTSAITVMGGAVLAVSGTEEIALGGALTLESGAVLGFNFTDRLATPQLSVDSGKTVTVGDAVKVKVSGDIRPIAGTKVLTMCGGFTGVNVSLADGAPKWAKRVYVNDDGNIVLEVQPLGTRIVIR